MVMQALVNAADCSKINSPVQITAETITSAGTYIDYLNEIRRVLTMHEEGVPAADVMVSVTNGILCGAALPAMMNLAIMGNNDHQSLTAGIAKEIMVNCH